MAPRRRAPSQVDNRSVIEYTSRSMNKLLLAAVTIACLLPFAGKAVHIDDPLFIWPARHIQASPADPYGFPVNWYGYDSPMWRVTQNPPLTSYYLALTAALAGWGSLSLHLAMILPAIAVVLGMYALARGLCTQPVHAALLGLFMPVALLSATTLMCDVLMLAFWVWAIALWMKGFEENNHRLLALGGILIAAAALTKYFGVALIPLLFSYSVIRKRSVGLWAVHFIIPLAFLAAYQWTTESLYGHGLLSDAASYADSFRTFQGETLLKGLIGLIFAGGCLAGTIFYIPWLWRGKQLLALLLIAAAGSALILALPRLGGLELRDGDGVRWGVVLQAALFLLGGINLLAVSLADLLRRRDALAWLLFLWVAGTFLFAAFINWTVNGRTLLPFVPAAGILVMRRLDERSFSLPLLLIPAALIALLVTWADYSLAGAGRDAAEIIHARYGGAGQIWFQGHWGFQYYMEERGAKPIDAYHQGIRRGDALVVPQNNTNTYRMDTAWFRLEDRIAVQPLPWLTTLSGVLGAGFYSDRVGPLPFSAGAVPPEKYLVYVPKEKK